MLGVFGFLRLSLDGNVVFRRFKCLFREYGLDANFFESDANVRGRFTITRFTIADKHLRLGLDVYVVETDNASEVYVEKNPRFVFVPSESLKNRARDLLKSLTW